MSTATAPGTQPRLVTTPFLIVCFATLSYFLAIGVLIPTLPLYVEGPLGGSNVAVGISVGSFSLAAVLLRPLTGRVGDRRGRRLLMLVGPSIVGVSIAAYTVVEALPLLVALRVVSGIGEAFFYVGAASAINDLAPDERRGEAVSYFSLALYGGLVLGPIIGETTLGDGRFDAVWLVAAAFALGSALLALFMNETRPDGTHEVATHLVHRGALGPGLVLAAIVWGLAGFNSFLPLFVREVGLEGSRLVFVTFSGTVLLIRAFGARIPDRLGPTRAASAALTTAAVGLACIGASPGPTGVFIGAALFGVGQALSFPALMSLAINGVPPSERGAAVGTFTAFFDLAFGLGAVGAGAVASLLGYRGSFFASAGVALLGLWFLLAQRRRADSGSETGAAAASAA